MPDEHMHEGTSKFRLRKIAPDASAAGRADNYGRSTDSQRSARDAASSISADARTIETIIRKAVDAVASSSSPSQLQREAAEAKERLSSTRSQLDASRMEIDALRSQLQALETKHIQFVEANIAFTQWRDQIEKERLSWAEANAKFAKRHEDNKAAKANLMAKYKAAVEDLDDMTAKYDNAAKEIARLTGNFPPTPTAPSSRHPLPPPISPPGSASLDRTRDREGSGPRRADITREREQRPPKDRSLRGVDRDPPRPPPLTQPQLVEQSVLRERLTSDMFTLSQKVLEERAQRAEEGRALAERRIFELEGQIARSSVNGGPSDHDRAGVESGVVHWRDTGGASRGYPPNLPSSHHHQSYQHHARRDSNDSPSSSTWTHSPHNHLPSSSHPQPIVPTPSASLTHSPTQLQHRYGDKPDGPPRQGRNSPGDWGRGDRDRAPPSRPTDAAGPNGSGEYDRHYEHSASSSSPYANPRPPLQHQPQSQPSQQHQQPTRPSRYHSSSSSSATTSPQNRPYPDWETRSDDRSSRSSSKRYSNGEPTSANSERRLPPLNPPSRDYEPSLPSARPEGRTLPPPMPPSSTVSVPSTRPPSPPNRNGYALPKVNGNIAPMGNDRRSSGSRTSYLNNTEDGDDDYIMRD